MINETEGKKKKSDPIISQNYNLKKKKKNYAAKQSKNKSIYYVKSQTFKSRASKYFNNIFCGLV